MNMRAEVAHFVRTSLTGLALLAFATMSQSGLAQGTMATILSDLWWNPNESGWGVTVDQQQDIMFLTFFIAGSNGSPYWVVAILSRTTPGGNIGFPVSFTGDMFEQKGTYYGSPWNAAQASARKVGTATFSASSLNSAALTYSIDGTQVQKELERQTLRLLDFTGEYQGGTYVIGCTGGDILEAGPLSVSHTGNQILIRAHTNACTFNGTYSQAGQLGSVAGTFTCDKGTSGAWAMTAMQRTATGFTAIQSIGGFGGCTTGAIGGILVNSVPSI